MVKLYLLALDFINIMELWMLGHKQTFLGTISIKPLRSSSHVNYIRPPLASSIGGNTI